MERYELLTAARRELEEMEAEHMTTALARGSANHGRAAEACYRAGDAIFDALNAEWSYCDNKAAGVAINGYNREPTEGAEGAEAGA